MADGPGAVTESQVFKMSDGIGADRDMVTDMVTDMVPEYRLKPCENRKSLCIQGGRVIIFDGEMVVEVHLGFTDLNPNDVIECRHSSSACLFVHADL